MPLHRDQAQEVGVAWTHSQGMMSPAPLLLLLWLPLAQSQRRRRRRRGGRGCHCLGGVKPKEGAVTGRRMLGQSEELGVRGQMWVEEGSSMGWGEESSWAALLDWSSSTLFHVSSFIACMN